MKKSIAMAGLMAAATALADAPAVTNVVMAQGADRAVTVQYELANAPAVVTLSIETNSGSAWLPIGERELARVTGDVNRKVTAASGTIKWVPEMELPAASGEVRAAVTAWPMDDTPDYMVVSLAADAAGAEDRIRYYTSTNAMPGAAAAVRATAATSQNPACG